MIPLLLSLVCNGDSAFCDRRYDQMTFPTTHNATSVRSGRHRTWVVPNQERDIDHQLKDGIRAFMIDVWYYNGIREQPTHELYTCHRYCVLGGQPLSKTFSKIKKFMDENPNEIITLIFENHVKNHDLEFALLKAGLFSMLHTQTQYQVWPLLKDMIQNQKRLVAFIEDEQDGSTVLMPLFRHAIETHYSVKRQRHLTCDFNRGDSSSPLFVLNHFLTRPVLRRAYNRRINQQGVLWGRSIDCFKKTKKIPNFLTVDFYQTGAVVKVSRELSLRW